jgi:hypothetical protein
MGWRQRIAVLVAGVATVALTAVGVAGASGRQPAPVGVEQQLEGEIDAMVASGMAEDDPKVELLEAQLAELRRGTRVHAPKEPGVDLAERVAGAKVTEARTEARVVAQASAGDSASAAATAGWQQGVVECEPVPQLLGAQQLAGAVCLSVPQPDGTNRYVAIGRDGVIRSVEFGFDGDVSRRPDRRMPVAAPAGTTFTPTGRGDVQVAVKGRAAVTVDIG